MDEQMIELMREAIEQHFVDRFGASIGEGPSRAVAVTVGEYVFQFNSSNVATAAHSVIAGKVAELEDLPRLIELQRTAAPDCAREDGWNDALDRAAAMLRAALACFAPANLCCPGPTGACRYRKFNQGEVR